MVDNGGARLIVPLFADPHLLEGGQGSQNRATKPHRVLAPRGHNDVDLHCAGSKGHNLLLQPVGNVWLHGGPTKQHCVGIKVLTDVNITLHDGSFMDATGFHAQEGRLEEDLRMKPNIDDGDDLPIRQPIALHQGGAGGCSGHLLLNVKGNIAQLLLDIMYNFPLGYSGEAIATLHEDLYGIVC